MEFRKQLPKPSDDESTVSDSDGSIIPPSPEGASTPRSLFSKRYSKSRTADTDKQENKEETVHVKQDPKEWSKHNVYEWIKEHFDEEIAKKFREEEVTGEMLSISERITTDANMERLGLRTFGKQEKFVTLIRQFREPKIKDQAAHSSLHKVDRLLTLKEKRKLSCETKELYNRKKKMITKKIKENWPESQPIPSFRRTNIEENSKLDDFVKGLNTEKYTHSECGLGAAAIRTMVMCHMRERRRQQSLSGLYQPTGNTTTESEIEMESSDASLSPGDNTPSTAEYFHDELTQDSCDTILMVYLGKLSAKDIVMVNHLKPLKGLFKLSFLRAQDKRTYIRAIANALIVNGHVKLKEHADLSNLSRECVVVIKPFINNSV